MCHEFSNRARHKNKFSHNTRRNITTLLSTAFIYTGITACEQVKACVGNQKTDKRKPITQYRMTDKNTRQHYEHKKMKGKHGLGQTVHERET